MLSLEQSVNSQFAKVFTISDAPLFKEMAEIYLSEAATLKKHMVAAPEARKLLVRNARKRLFIGIGTELLLKAIYLGNGYCINKPRGKRTPLKFPFSSADATQATLKADDTYSFACLIDHLAEIVPLVKATVVRDGLSIARLFRNKEGHVVTSTHKFDPTSFRAIEAALVDVYAVAFRQVLTVHFSFMPKEKGVWHMTKL